MMVDIQFRTAPASYGGPINQNENIGRQTPERTKDNKICNWYNLKKLPFGHFSSIQVGLRLLEGKLLTEATLHSLQRLVNVSWQRFCPQDVAPKRVHDPR